MKDFIVNCSIIPSLFKWYPLLFILISLSPSCSFIPFLFLAKTDWNVLGRSRHLIFEFVRKCYAPTQLFGLLCVAVILYILFIWILYVFWRRILKHFTSKYASRLASSTTVSRIPQYHAKDEVLIEEWMRKKVMCWKEDLEDLWRWSLQHFSSLILSGFCKTLLNWLLGHCIAYKKKISLTEYVLFHNSWNKDMH